MGSATERLPQEYKGPEHPIWCPGCGDFGVLDAMYKAFAKLNLPQEQIVIVSGIGCSGRTPGFVKSYGFHVVHGRVLPVSQGVKLANPSLEVIGVGGDGDGFAIGGGHIPHAARRNADILYLVMDNSIYGLTKGQFSPTSPIQLQTGSTPYGNVEEPLNPIAMTIAYGCSFVARGYSGKPQQLTDLIIRGMQHPGFAFINVISPCITYYNTYKDIPKVIADIPADHDPKDKVKAFALAQETSKLYMGLFYQVQKPTFEEKLLEPAKKAEAAGIPRLEEILAKYD